MEDRKVTGPHPLEARLAIGPQPAVMSAITPSRVASLPSPVPVSDSTHNASLAIPVAPRWRRLKSVLSPTLAVLLDWIASAVAPQGRP